MRLHVLRVEFEVTAELDRIARHLRFLKQTAEQPISPARRVHYHVAHRDGAHVIERDGEEIDLQFDANGVLAAVGRCIHSDALDAWPEATRLAGLTARAAGVRFVVVGGSAWDRMRLAWALIERGARIEGVDEALLHRAEVTPLPWPLRISDPWIPLPASLPPLDALPGATAWGVRTWAADLAEAGIAWQIRTGPVDRVILLETNYGGQTRGHRLAAHELARGLAPFCRNASPINGVRAAAELAGSALGIRLWLGSFADPERIWGAPVS